jgi:hypothetical protein
MNMFSAIGGWFSGAFLSPAFFGFLALIPVIILLYILKLRRTEIVIPSTFLWIKSLQDLTANAPFQRLRKNLLMFLQILALLLLAIALARPFVKAQAREGANVCVILDRSASMQTLEDGKTRLELAKAAALDMVDTMKGGDKMMVVSFAEKADVLCELTTDKYRLRRAINGVTPTDARTKIRDVMLIARSLAPDNPDIPAVVSNLELILMSDGKISDLEGLGAQAATMRFLQFGETRDNVGIVAFSERKELEGAGERQTFVLVHNENNVPVDTTLTLYFNDSALAVEEITLDAGSDREVVFTHPDLGEGLMRVELDRPDAFAVDNRAWLALRPDTQLKVLLVTDSTSTTAYVLKLALSLEPRVALSAVAPASFAPTDEYDLVIFDAFTPAELPGGTLVFINTLPAIPGLASEGTIKNPPVLAHDAEHPAMRFLNPGNLSVTEAMQVTLPEGARTLISTRGGPLVADVSRGGQQILVVAFDLGNSNWPLRLSFPLFIQNVLSWVPRSALAADRAQSTGEPLTLMSAAGGATATVTLPDGQERRVNLDPARPVYFAETLQAGPYHVDYGEYSEVFAVNLLDRVESAIAPADALQVGRAQVLAERGTIKQTRELWPWFVMAALAVLAVEWWIYSRRAWM